MKYTPEIYLLLRKFGITQGMLKLLTPNQMLKIERARAAIHEIHGLHAPDMRIRAWRFSLRNNCIARAAKWENM